MYYTRFTTRSSAASHKRVVHDKIKGYVCDLCGYACGTNGELRQHRAIHSDEKPFVCRKCSKRYESILIIKAEEFICDNLRYKCLELKKHLPVE